MSLTQNLRRKWNTLPKLPFPEMTKPLKDWWEAEELRDYMIQSLIPFLSVIESTIRDKNVKAEDLIDLFPQQYRNRNSTVKMQEFQEMMYRAWIRLLINLYRNASKEKKDVIRPALQQWFNEENEIEFPDTVYWPKDLHELDQWIEWERNGQRGQYALLFPVVYPKPDSSNTIITELIEQVTETGMIQGGLVRVNVSMVLRDPEPERLHDRSIWIAPWSRFQCLDDQHSSFEEICTQVFDALEECETYTSDSSVIPILSFEPIQPQDFPLLKNQEDKQRSEVWQFSPWVADIQGASLGITLALTIFAASQNYCLRPVIGTGVVNSNGTISAVGGEKEKGEVIKAFLEHSNEKNWTIVLPTEGDWQRFPRAYAEIDQFSQLQEMLKEEQEKKLFTDGFQDFRDILLEQYHVKLDKLDSVQTQLQDWLKQPPLTSLEWSNSTHSEPYCPQFDAPPKPLVDDLIQVWVSNLDPDRMHQTMQRVVLPLPLHFGKHVEWFNDAPLAERISASVNAHFEQFSTLVDSNSIRINLKEEYKLIFVVYPPQSKQWAEGMADEEAQKKWKAVRDELVELTKGDTPQQVLFVHADLHHYRDWPTPNNKET